MWKKYDKIVKGMNGRWKEQNLCQELGLKNYKLLPFLAQFGSEIPKIDTLKSEPILAPVQCITCGKKSNKTSCLFIVPATVRHLGNALHQIVILVSVTHECVTPKNVY